MDVANQYAYLAQRKQRQVKTIITASVYESNIACLSSTLINIGKRSHVKNKGYL